MSRHTVCPTCGAYGYIPLSAPPEPPVGTWVKDRYGATHVRTKDSDGRIGWAASPTGYCAFGKWEAMWAARGPLVECGPWGRE